ncbi:MAG: pectate lyase [Bacteroidaceae bacterium]|nr:pectate lyase [Bacteroidaceae bacterium]
MKNVFFLLLPLFFFFEGTSAQDTSIDKSKDNYKSWVHCAPKFDDLFFKTQEATRIGNNVLLYQQTTGGWPKNINMTAELTEKDKANAIQQQSNINLSTIDNNATTTEIKYLARLYQATNLKTYKNAVINGINYLFKAQYNNGGWPQFYPRPVGYYIQITYNDNAMVNVMKLLRDVYKKKSPYAFIPDSICQKAKSSFDKGIECILNTQVRNKKGELTVWCAQHDKNSLKPCKARAYELPSLSGQESDGIVLLLMGIKHPSQRITNAIKGAIKWYNESEIKGLKKEFFTNSKGKRDFKMIPCDNCQPMWARFYDLDTNRPFFCDRDGIKKDDISQIGYERRNGYKWYNKDGFTVLGKYKKWKEKNLK